jgi:hypothetical protein
MDWLGNLSSLVFDWILATISLIQESPLSFLTFLGIIPTIVLGYSSMNHQRRNAARESIEQLDDLRLGSVKIKAILHQFPKWPFNHVTVKLKIYSSSRVAGISRPNNRFYVFPRHVFRDYSFETVSNGYIVHLYSSNPVEIRKSIEDLFDRMSQEHAGGQVEYEEFLRHYSEFYQGKSVPIHEEILDKLSYLSATHKNHIPGRLDRKYDEKIVSCAISDLVNENKIKEESSQRYTLTADWEEISYIFEDSIAEK